MSTSWTLPVTDFAAGTPSTTIGLWSLMFSATVATAELCRLPVLDEDICLSRALAALREAVGELEWVQPHLAVTGAVLDVGPAPLDDVAGCRAAITTLILTASATIGDLLAAPSLELYEALTLGRITLLLSSAHFLITGPVAFFNDTGRWPSLPDA